MNFSCIFFLNGVTRAPGPVGRITPRTYSNHHPLENGMGWGVYFSSCRVSAAVRPRHRPVSGQARRSRLLFSSVSIRFTLGTARPHHMMCRLVYLTPTNNRGTRCLRSGGDTSSCEGHPANRRYRFPVTTLGCVLWASEYSTHMHTVSSTRIDTFHGATNFHQTWAIWGKICMFPLNFPWNVGQLQDFG